MHRRRARFATHDLDLLVDLMNHSSYSRDYKLMDAVADTRESVTHQLEAPLPLSVGNVGDVESGALRSSNLCGRTRRRVSSGAVEKNLPDETSPTLL
jgi:hypothetical protein